MKKTILVALLLMCTPSYAENDATITTRGLTDAQRDQLEVLAQQMRAEATDSKSITHAVTYASEQLGMTPAEFVESDLGKHMIEVELLNRHHIRYWQLYVGIGWTVVLLIIWLVLFWKICVVYTITYDKDGNKSVVKTQNENENPATRWMMLITLIAILAFGQMIIWI